MSTETNHEAIRTTVTNVAHYIDGRQWDALRALYADNVTVDYTSLFGGEAQTQAGDDLIGGWQGVLTPLGATQHMLGPVTIELSADGQSATARCHVRGYHFAENAPSGTEWMVAGHYIFKLAPDGTDWKITAMTLEAFYQTGNLNMLQEAAGS